MPRNFPAPGRCSMPATADRIPSACTTLTCNGSPTAAGFPASTPVIHITSCTVSIGSHLLMPHMCKRQQQQSFRSRTTRISRSYIVVTIVLPNDLSVDGIRQFCHNQS